MHTTARLISAALLVGSAAAQFGGAATVNVSAPSSVNVTYGRSVERMLMDYLASKSSTSVRPVRNPNVALDVDLKVAHDGVLEVDIEKGYITNRFIYEVKWKNVFMSWDVSKYNVPYVLAPAEAVWKPDLNIVNAIASSTSLLSGRPKVAIYNDGTSVMQVVDQLTTQCKFDLESFPFDEHACPVYIGTGQATEKEINMVVSSGVDNIPAAQADSGLNCVSWILKNVTQSTDTVSVTLSAERTESREYNVFTVYIQRASTFYVMNGFVPVVIATVVASLTFCLPASMVERMGFGATTLLTVIAVMFVVADKIPQQGKQTLIDKFFMGSLIFHVIAMGITSYVVVMTLNAALASMKGAAGPISDPAFLDKITRVGFPIAYFIFAFSMVSDNWAAVGPSLPSGGTI